MSTVRGIFPTLTYQRAAELHALNCTQHSAIEYAELADRLAVAAVKVAQATNTHNFAMLRSAYLDLHDITFQTNYLNVGLQNAIQSVSNRSKS